MSVQDHRNTHYFKQHEVSLETLRDWLRKQFGAYVVAGAVRSFNRRLGHSVPAGANAYTPRGGLYVPSTPALVGIGSSVASRPTLATPHTFRGDIR